MEELKIVLGTIATLGTEAKWAFFVWLSYNAFKVSALAGTVLILAHWIIRALGSANSDERTLRAIADIVGERYYEPEQIIGKIAVLKSKAAV